MNPEFAGTTVTFPTEIGEIYGARLWRMDRRGRLLPRSVEAAPWVDGENKAVCVAPASPMDASWIVDPTGQGRRGVNAVTQVPMVSIPDSVNWSFSGVSPHLARVQVTYKYQVTWSDGATETYDTIEVSKPAATEHQSPVESCMCGFYAFTDAAHEELERTQFMHWSVTYPIVRGVIKGFGRTLIGSRGFRCEKAEIAAVLDPAHGWSSAPDLKLWMREQLLLQYPSAVMLSTVEELKEFAPLGLL